MALLGCDSMEASVRKLMRAMATNKILSLYSFKGQKGKLAMQNMAMCSVIRSMYFICTLLPVFVIIQLQRAARLMALLHVCMVTNFFY